MNIETMGIDQSTRQGTQGFLGVPSFCFLVSVKELILQQKQLSYEKEDALSCILANFQDQNCNKNSRNWP